jgi:transposase
MAKKPVFEQGHMKSAGEIAKTFGVSRNTVARWTQKGAPIGVIGKKYHADYDELWEWIKKNAKT